MRAPPSPRIGWRSRVIVHAVAVAALVLAACSPDGVIPAMEEDGALLPPTSFAIGTDPVTGAWVETDKDDYAPGETVQITAAGWAAGEVVTLHLTREPMTSEDDTWTVTAGAEGTFETSYMVKESDLWVEFTMTATGPVSGSVVEVFFTDGYPQSITPTPTARTVVAGGSVEYALEVVMTGNSGNCPTLQFSLSGLPAGASASFSGTNPFSFQGTGTFTRTVTISTESSVQSGEYTLAVTLTPSGCQGQPAVSTNLTLTVEPGTPSNAPPVLTAIGDKVVDEETLLTFTATATDEDIASLTFSLGSPASGTFPTGATITPGGVFTWTPTEAQGPGTYRVRVVILDNGGLSDEEEIEITVNEVNRAPVLDPVGDATIDENAPFTFTATATDPDLPANTLTFSLVGAPAGASIDGVTGVFTWTPTEAQGPGSYTFTVRVTDDGVPSLGDEEEITITVNEVNDPPVLDPIGDKVVDEETLLTFIASATDPDHPPNTLKFSLDLPASGTYPTGASIDEDSGVFAWTPSEADGPGTFRVTVVVTDDGGLSDSEEIQITVREVNLPPVLQTIGDFDVGDAPITFAVDEEVVLTFTATATDPDLPANALTFSLVGAPAGAGITAAGVFTWTPTEAQGPGSYTFTVRVTDDGGTLDPTSGNLSDEKEISITVNDVNRAPELAAIGSQTVDEGSPLTFTATATDPDIPANALTFSLDAGAPAGASITPGGVFTWTPLDGNATHTVTVRVTDDGGTLDPIRGNLDDHETVTITVLNVAPTITDVSLAADVAVIHPITQPLVVSATYTDPGTLDSHTCKATLSGSGLTDANGTVGSAAPQAGTCASSVTFPEAGVYTGLTLWVADESDSDEEVREIMVVVYDSTAGFVTGGGWIHSPAGAFAPDPSLAGRANFGFVSRYQRGANVPTGNTEFVFQAGGLNFHSSSYQWLVVNQGGTNAQFKGTGRLNGQSGYEFVIWATDGGTGSGAAPDSFRIQIKDPSGTTVYDNKMNAPDSEFGTEIAGGSIVIHTGGNGGGNGNTKK